MTYQTTVICYMLVEILGGLSSDGTLISVLLYSMPMEVKYLYGNGLNEKKEIKSHK